MMDQIGGVWRSPLATLYHGTSYELTQKMSSVDGCTRPWARCGRFCYFNCCSNQQIPHSFASMASGSQSDAPPGNNDLLALLHNHSLDNNKITGSSVFTTIQLVFFTRHYTVSYPTFLSKRTIRRGGTQINSSRRVVVVDENGTHGIARQEVGSMDNR